jgi:predicted nuclease of predicted toxin-antitoxin system
VTLKTDENLPLDAAVTLREHGFDVETIWDEGLSGADDAMVARRAQAEGRILLTLDLDFANIQAYPPDQHAGITVLRLGVQDRATVITYIRRLAAMLRQRSPTGELWIIERDRVRFRRSD